ncbi:hypothetical protein MXB_3008 [Myxobolus squamalis]|nr:hypothetical protein MXB_3008 [Myxobolus squamalis]
MHVMAHLISIHHQIIGVSQSNFVYLDRTGFTLLMRILLSHLLKFLISLSTI